MSLPIPGELPGCCPVSATALAAARYISYGEVQGLYIALLTSAGLAPKMREPGLMKVDIEYTRLDGISRVRDVDASISEAQWLGGSEAQRNGWLKGSDRNLVPGLLIGVLRRSEPGLAKGLMLRASIVSLNLLLRERVTFKYDPLVPKLQSLTRGI